MRRVAILVLLALGLLAAGPAQAQSGFQGLRDQQRVYDLTGALTPDQAYDLQLRLDRLARQVGADVVVVVRELNADPAQTLDQAEALQQAWVALTGRSQDTAVGILVNREPGEADQARAGIYVGSTYDDGNVPRDEQEKIVADALIPPLRDGDVAASLTAGIDRLSSSIVDGPPRNAFQRWAPGAWWVAYALLALALVGGFFALRFFGRRETPGAPELPPTLVRPGDLEPALAGALAVGRPSPSTVPAVVLDLAARGALRLEPEGPKKLQVAMVEPSFVRGKLEALVWRGFVQRAEAGVVGSKQLEKLGRDTSALRSCVEGELREHGWWNPRASSAKVGLVAIGIGGSLLAVLGVAVTANGLGLLGLIAVVPLAVLALGSFVLAGLVSNLSRRGGREALRWKAYRTGLKDAASSSASLDLDAALPDVVAMGLGNAYKDRLKESGSTLRAFHAVPAVSGFVPWIVFNGAFASSSGGGAGVVSGGGAGGGGGAAGST